MMEETLNRFLAESPLASKIRLPAAVMVRRTEMSLLDVMNIRKAGNYGPVMKKEEMCELVVGGQCVALGKIVRRRGEYYFKVSRIGSEANTKEVAS